MMSLACSGCSILFCSVIVPSLLTFRLAHAEREMDRDNFKSADEAVTFGLIDEVISKRPLPPKEPAT